jgi:hypothetical protein
MSAYRTNGAVAGALKSALEGSTQAAIWWAKTRMKWSEKILARRDVIGDYTVMASPNLRWDTVRFSARQYKIDQRKEELDEYCESLEGNRVTRASV